MTKPIDRMSKGFAINRYRRSAIKYDEDDGSYSVPSQSHSHHSYRVFQSTHKHWVCECRDFTLNICRDTPKNCKHIYAVIAFLEKENKRLQKEQGDLA
jgi:hypothetical protein